MSMDVIYVIVLGAMVAGFVQGLSGFAFGMVAMSFWAWTIDPALAIPLAVFGALSGQILAAFSVRGGFDVRALWPFIAGALVGIPLGIAVVPHLNTHWFKAGVGLLLVLWCPAMLFARQLPHITVGGRFADGVVGLAGGVMGGVGGFSGTLPTLWCSLRGYERATQRAIIQNFNLSVLSVTMGMYLVTNIVTADILPLFALVLSAMLVPTLLGTRLYKRINDVVVRRLVLGLLTASGIMLLASSIPHLWLRLA